MLVLPTVLAAALPGAEPAVDAVVGTLVPVNLLTNGSFELGLGAEPYYPGWRIDKKDLAASETPDLPGLDTTVVHSGRQSLKLSRARGKGIAYLDFESPLFSGKSVTHFSFWVKASRPGVKLVFGGCPEDGKGRVVNAPRLLAGDASTDWQLWQCALPVDAGVVHMRLEFSGEDETPFSVWVDDVSWTMGDGILADRDARPRAGAVEAILLPPDRNGIRFAGQPVVFRWSANADTGRAVTLDLTLRDLTRDGEAASVWRGETMLSPSPGSGEIVLPDVKRGAWWAELSFCDKDSGKLLGVARERFTMMTDLHTVPAPVDFDAGYHGGFEFGPSVGFNWRGYWTLDDFFATQFQTGLRVQRDISDWGDLEPERDVYEWGYLDARVEAARRNGCTTIICTPHKPLNMLPADYRKLLANPYSGSGRWIYKTAKDISKHAVRSAPMGSSGDPEKRHALFAPDPKALVDFMTTLASRYDGKVAAIEFINEANLYIDPEGLIDYYYKPAYPSMKRVAPDLPVLMNQTMDFAADGNGYTGQFLKLGGLDYCDGIFHHPYGVSELQDNGLEGIKTLERLRETYSKPDKTMLLGMSEIHGLAGSSRSFIRGEVVQRALLDWSGGCRWSAGGLLTRQTFYEGTGPRHWFLRGAFAPGVGAVHMNGLYATLGGYRFLRRIELDDNVLIMAFEKVGGAADRERYAVAIDSARLPLAVSMLEADLRGIEVSAFDFTGELFKQASQTAIRLGPGAMYLKSNDSALFDRLGAGRVSWGQSILGEVEQVRGPEVETAVYATGIPPDRMTECGIVNRWMVPEKTAEADSHGDGDPVKEKIVDGSGDLVWPADQTRRVDHPLPYVLLSTGGGAANALHWAHTSIAADRSGKVTWYFSATGPAVLWFNGTHRVDLSDLPYGLVGHEWRSVTVPLVAGMNHILVQVTSLGAPCAFALSANKDALDDATVRVDDQGYIRKWKIVGPWKNPRDSEGKYQGNARAYPPEQRTDFSLCATGLRGMPLIWHEATYTTPVVPHPWVDGVSYAYTVVQVPEDTSCLASLGSDDGYVLWVNGELVGRGAVSRALKMDSDKLPVVLKKGANQVLFKIDDTGGAGSFSLRFLREDGRPVPLTIGD